MIEQNFLDLKQDFKHLNNSLLKERGINTHKTIINSLTKYIVMKVQAETKANIWRELMPP